MSRWSQTEAERFWAKVEKTDSCWLWTAAKNDKGYGQFSVGSGLVYAHRYAYEALVGPIPEGLVIDHLCRVTLCVNPAHLEPVTNLENQRRGFAARPMPTHCPKGHEYAETAVFWAPRFTLACRRCNNDQHNARAKARRAQ